MRAHARVWVCECILACVHVTCTMYYVSVCMHMYVCVWSVLTQCVCMHTCVCAYVHVCVCMCVHACVCMYTNMSVCVWFVNSLFRSPPLHLRFDLTWPNLSVVLFVCVWFFTNFTVCQTEMIELSEVMMPTTSPSSGPWLQYFTFNNCSDPTLKRVPTPAGSLWWQK